MSLQRILRESDLGRHFQALLRPQTSRPLMGIFVLFVAACAGSNTPTPITATSTTSDINGQIGRALESIETKNLSNRPLPTLRNVVRRVAPSVVAINVRGEALDIFLRRIGQSAAGTGVVVRSDGYILTNNHVIADSSEVSVTLDDGRTFDAEVVGRFVPGDLAVLKIDSTGLQTIEVRNDEGPQVGDWVIAVGNALGLEGGPTVTAGIVSGLSRSIQTADGITLADLVQTDAAINEGNSGGPLVDLDGNLVGLNTTLIADARGIGFAISAAVVERYSSDLINYGRVRLPLMGIRGDTLNAELASSLSISVDGGVIITDVPEGPAKQGGIEPGDVIVALDGKPVNNFRQFRSVLWVFQPDQQIVVSVIRGSQPLVFSVALGRLPD